LCIDPLTEEEVMGLFRKGDPHQDVTSIGNLLIDAGICTKEQVQKAICYQCDNPDAMLGEALVQLGSLTRDQLDVILARQEIMRSNGRGKGISRLANLTTERIGRASTKVDEVLSGRPPGKKFAMK
jgi:hypothetical protein